jgi:hypothetical protein
MYYNADNATPHGCCHMPGHDAMQHSCNTDSKPDGNPDICDTYTMQIKGRIMLNSSSVHDMVRMEMYTDRPDDCPKSIRSAETH